MITCNSCKRRIRLDAEGYLVKHHTWRNGPICDGSGRHRRFVKGA